MTFQFNEGTSTLTIFISGEMDHHSAREMMQEIDMQIDLLLPKNVRINLSKLSFTDSSGIAVLIRTSRKITQIEGTFAVENTPPQAKKVFKAAGLEKLLVFEHDIGEGSF